MMLKQVVFICILALCVGCGEKDGVVRTIEHKGGELIQVVYTVVDGKKNGEARYYFNASKDKDKTEDTFIQGPLLCIENWKDGKLNGETVVYFRTGEVFARYHYRDGKSHGTGVQYFVDGKIADERTWVDGMLQGTHKVYYPSGNIKEITHYKDNKKEGLSQTFYDKKGRKESEAVYTKGKLHGPFKRYYITGQLASIQEYREGTLVGMSRSFYKTGRKMEEINHDIKDHKKAYRAWYSDGTMLPEGSALRLEDMNK